jgi:hypothetical protein
LKAVWIRNVRVSDTCVRLPVLLRILFGYTLIGHTSCTHFVSIYTYICSATLTVFET